MKLTEQQIRDTVQRVYTDSPHATTRKVAPVILRRALAGDKSILFVLHTHYMRHQNGTTAADAVKAWAHSVGYNPDGTLRVGTLAHIAAPMSPEGRNARVARRRLTIPSATREDSAS